MIFFRIAVAAIDLGLGIAFLLVLYRALTERAAEPSPRRRRAGTILIGVAGAILLFSGALKLAQPAPVVAQMTSLGLGGWKLTPVAGLELLSGLLFLLRPLRSLGLLVASAYLGAAICAHIAVDQFFAILPTMLVLGCCWLGTALRHPQMLWSFGERALLRERVPSLRHGLGEESRA